MPDEARRWLVSGTVQGVGFRWWLRERAGALFLRGWVRNLSDGRVEAVAWGGADALDAFDRAARQGPPASRVVRAAATPWTGRFDGGDGFAVLADADDPAEP